MKPPSRLTARSIAATAGLAGDERLELAEPAVARRVGQQAATTVRVDDGGHLLTAPVERKQRQRHRQRDQASDREQKEASGPPSLAARRSVVLL